MEKYVDIPGNDTTRSLLEETNIAYGDEIDVLHLVVEDEELKRIIDAAQRIQMSNPPRSEQWQQASVVLHACVDSLMGHHVPDARGAR